MGDIYEDIGDYNPNKYHKILIAFDGMIGDIVRIKTSTNSSMILVKVVQFALYTTLWKTPLASSQSEIVTKNLV